MASTAVTADPGAADERLRVTPRNIFILANTIEESGGVQRVVHQLAQDFSHLGHRVELFGITRHPEPVRYVEDPAYRAESLYPETDAGRRWRPRRLRDRLDLPAYRSERDRRVRRAEAVDKLAARFDAVSEGLVIVAQVFAMEWVAEADPKHLRIIGQSHESYEASRGLTAATVGSTRYQRMMQLFRDIDLFQLLTRTDAEKFERDGMNNTSVIHNAVRFYPDAAADLSDKTVISIGRYHPQKNYPALIHAWALVRERHPDWRLKIFGHGPDEEKLRAHISRLGLEDTAKLMGPTAEAEHELMNSSVFAMSSDFEGLPLVLSEAMACGVPCVAFDCAPGIREIIADGVDGIVVPPRQVKALAEGICRLIENPDLRRGMGSAARENITRFSTGNVMRQWHDVFEMLER